MKKKIFILAASALLITGCGKDPKPQNPKIDKKDDKTVQKDQNSTQPPAEKKEKKIPCDLSSGLKKISGPAPLKIRFNSTVINSSFKSAGYKKIEWSFGDNTVSSEKNPTKIYEKTGLYTVTCTVEDEKSTRLSEKLLIEVSENAPGSSYLFVTIGENSALADSKKGEDSTILLKLGRDSKRAIKKIKILTGAHLYTLNVNSVDDKGFVRIGKNIKKKILSDIARTKRCEIETHDNRGKRVTRLTKRQIARLLKQ